MRAGFVCLRVFSVHQVFLSHEQKPSGEKERCSPPSSRAARPVVAGWLGPACPLQVGLKI